MFITLFYFFLALLILVVFHEYGHFQVARWCGVKVLRFSFGFGKILACWKDKKGTEYVWSLFPLGGYVKMLDETEGPVAEDEQSMAFNRQPVWKKTLIVLAGPFFNFIFAFVALWLVAIIGLKSLAPVIDQVATGSIAAKAGLSGQNEIIAVNDKPVRSWHDFQYVIMPHIGSDGVLTITAKSLSGQAAKHYLLDLKSWTLDSQKPDLLDSLGITPFLPVIPSVIGEVLADQPAAQSGLQAGDRVISVDKQAIGDWLDLVTYIKERPRQTVQIRIERKGVHKNIPVLVGAKDTEEGVEGFLGLRSQKMHWPDHLLRTERHSPIAAVPIAFHKTVDLTKATLMLLGRLFIGQIGIENISGPVGIAKGAGDSARSGLVYYLTFLALVSISLGVLNLLPIPMLDGGHILFYIIEGVIRRPLSDEVKSISIYMGLAALMLLMLVALFNDVSRLA